MEWRGLLAFCYIGVIRKVSLPPGCIQAQALALPLAPCLDLIAFIFGVLTDRKLKAMALIREQFVDAPSNENTAQLQILEKQQTTYLNICAGTLTLSVWIMAVARYLVF